MYRLNGNVSSENLGAIKPLLERLLDGQVTPVLDGLHLDGVMEGDDARDVNRRLLSALRRVERRTRLRAEWTADGVTYRFFDYALKSERPALSARLRRQRATVSRAAFSDRRARNRRCPARSG